MDSYYYKGTLIFKPDETDNEPTYAYQKVKEELIVSALDGVKIPYQINRDLPILAAHYKTSGNPHYMLIAQRLCNAHKFEAPNYVKELITDAITAIHEDEIPARETPKTVKNRSARYQATVWFSFIRAAGVDPKKASRMVAKMYVETFSGVAPLKASTLQKNYGKLVEEYSHPEFKPLDILAKELYETDDDIKTTWDLIIKYAEECDEVLRGRRGDASEIYGR